MPGAPRPSQSALLVVPTAAGASPTLFVEGIYLDPDLRKGSSATRTCLPMATSAVLYELMRGYGQSVNGAGAGVKDSGRINAVRRSKMSVRRRRSMAALHTYRLFSYRAPEYQKVSASSAGS